MLSPVILIQYVLTKFYIILNSILRELQLIFGIFYTLHLTIFNYISVIELPKLISKCWFYVVTLTDEVNFR